MEGRTPPSQQHRFTRSSARRQEEERRSQVENPVTPATATAGTSTPRTPPADPADPAETWEVLSNRDADSDPGGEALGLDPGQALFDENKSIKSTPALRKECISAFRRVSRALAQNRRALRIETRSLRAELGEVGSDLRNEIGNARREVGDRLSKLYELIEKEQKAREEAERASAANPSAARRANPVAPSQGQPREQAQRPRQSDAGLSPRVHFTDQDARGGTTPISVRRVPPASPRDEGGPAKQQGPATPGPGASRHSADAG